MGFPSLRRKGDFLCNFLDLCKVQGTSLDPRLSTDSGSHFVWALLLIKQVC